MARVVGDSTHYPFFLNGNKNGQCIMLPSVTYILNVALGSSQYLSKWAYNLGLAGGETPAEFMERRSKEGNAAHAFLEKAAQAKKVTPKTGYDEAIIRYLTERKPVVLATEQTVYSLEMGYAGTLDLLIEEPCVVDLKTKKKTIYKAYAKELIQCKAYGMAALEMGKVTVEPSTAILIAKDNGRYTYDDRQAPAELWYAVLACYKELVKAGLHK